MNLETLPSFALSQILTCLHMDDVCRSLVRASKTMVTSLSDAITNVHIDCTGKRKALAGPGILQMLARMESLTSIALASLPPEAATDDDLNCLLSKHANLTRLSLKNLNVTNPVLRLPYLRTLEIVNCKYLSLPPASATLLPSIQHIDFSKSSVSDNELFTFLRQLPDGCLKSLRLEACKNLKHDFGPEYSDDGSFTPLPSLSALQYVDLSSSNVDGHYVTLLLLHTPSLTQLDIETCWQIQLLTVNHPVLKTLKMRGCTRIRSLTFENCGALTELDVSASKFSNEGLLALYMDGGVPNLTVLRARECWGLTLTSTPPSFLEAFVGPTASQVGLSLQTLDIGHSRLGPATVKSLLHRSRHVLRELDIGGLNFETNDSPDQPFVPSPLIDPTAGVTFPHLSYIGASHIRCDATLILDLVRSSPALEFFKCFFIPVESPTLKRLTIHGPVPDEGFANLMTACPNLQHILLDDCRDLTVAVVNSPSLTTFTLPRARQLERLELHCPALTQLDITACSHLRSLVLDVPTLRELKMEWVPDHIYAALPSEIKERLHPTKGIRTERGGVEASVKRKPLVKQSSGTPTTPTSPGSDGGSGGVVHSDNSTPVVNGGDGSTVESKSNDTNEPSQSMQPPDELTVLEWRIARLVELLEDSELTQATRYGLQRQLAIQKAAKNRELKRVGIAKAGNPSNSEGKEEDGSPK